MKRVISSEDALAWVREKRQVVVREDDWIITDVAKETLARFGVRLADASAQVAGPAAFSGGSSWTPVPGLSAALQNFASVHEAGGVSPSDPSADLDLSVSNGRVFLPGVGFSSLNIGIKGEKIVALTTSELSARKRLDAQGKLVIPGVMDPHIHLGLFAPLDDELVTETRAALLGGVTTVGCFFNREGSYKPLLEELARKVPALSSVDLVPHLSLRSQIHLDEMESYVRDYGVTSFKMYMCGIPGILPHQKDDFIFRAFSKAASLPGKIVIAIHAENASLVEGASGRAAAGSMTLRTWGDTHPNIAEEEAAIRAVFLAKRTGVTLYLVHISSKEAIGTLAGLKSGSVHVETTSPYLTIDDASALGVYAKMAPPFRDRASVDALWQGIAQGVVDTIGTDNVTMTSIEKNVSGGMAEAVPGYSALPTHLAAVLDEGYHRRGFSLETLIPLMTSNPARIYGLQPEKGNLLPGSDADIVVLDIDRVKTVDPKMLGSRSDFSLYQGKTLKGWAAATIKSGKIATLDGVTTGEKPSAKLIKRIAK